MKSADYDFTELIKPAISGLTYRLQHDEHWLHVRTKESNATPSQGWKLHISAHETNAKQILSRVLPPLVEADVSFKLVPRLSSLRDLNSGGYGRNQRGKFMTIYPHDEASAVQIAVDLERATNGLTGPPIATDRRLGPDSIVHYRYGAFSTEFMQDSLGSVSSCLVSPSW